MQAHRPSLLFLSLTVGVLNVAWAYPEYRVTVVARANSAATDINSAGVVVGTFPYSATSTRAFLNRGTGMVDLGALRGVASAAVAINDKGQVLGHWTTSTRQRRGFIYHAGKVRDIGVIPGRISTFTDINYSGYITAYGTVPDSEEGPHGFLRAPDGTYKDIGSVPVEEVFPMTYAYALNSGNQIAGASGPLSVPDQPLRAIGWAKGVMRDLGDFGMAPNAALAINNCGQMTGYASVDLGFRDRHAFLYSNGRMIDLESSPGTEELYSEGAGINCRGHVVGRSSALSGFIYRGKRMQSLNALIDPARGWNITGPVAINNNGQIAATAVRGGVQYAVRLDLIRPLAEPLPKELEQEPAPELSQAAKDARASEDAQGLRREIAQPVPQ